MVVVVCLFVVAKNQILSDLGKVFLVKGRRFYSERIKIELLLLDALAMVHDD